MTTIDTSLPPPPSQMLSESGGSSSSSSNSILSSKVQRALQVRTDTPAMTNALTSLANLQYNHNIDARNVRNAIEEDALHQARMLEEELKHLVDMVGNMRGSIQDVLNVAERVGRSLETSVIHPSSKVSSSTRDGEISSGSEENKVNSIDEESHGFEEEQKLAAMIADAFNEREEAAIRYNAISEFLEKYDLDEKDSYLLEHYAFDNVFESQGNSNTLDRKKIVRFSTSSSERTEDEEVDDGMAFLNALQRVTMIRKELSSSFDDDLSGIKGQSNNATKHLGATSAMRMVENLASKQERAFERLYHFLHNHLDLNQSSLAHVPTSSNNLSSSLNNMLQHHSAEDEDAMDETLGHPFIRKSLVVLKYVPAYYAHTLELIATSRRSAVTRKFLLALTNGYNGMAPIEMKAHDPVNYVGDMLAFVFRTVSVESELAKSLVIVDDGEKDGIDSNREGTYEGNEYSTTFMSASNVLNDALSGIARPLKNRITQVIASLARRPDEDDDNNGIHEHSFMDEEADSARLRLSYLYSIGGLLLFYRSATSKAVNKLPDQNDTKAFNDEDKSNDQQNALIQCVTECLEDCARAYVASLKVYCAKLDHLASISNESQAHLCQTVVTRLCDVRSTSPGFGPSYEEDTIGISVDALEALSLEYLCDTLFEAVMVTCSNIDDVVTIRVALSIVQKNGLSKDSATKWDMMLAKEEEKMIEAQIDRDTTYVLDECGLGAIASALESMKAVYIEGMVISSHPGLSQQSLEEAMSKFYTSLIDLPLPEYNSIKDPDLKKRSRKKIAMNVAAMYTEIYNMVCGEKGGYADLSFMVNTPDQVKALICN